MELVFSILALALSVISLLWQMVSHILAGDRVIVSEGTSYPVGSIGYLPNCQTITAANRGRTPVTVQSIALDVGNNSSAEVAMHLVPELSDRLPFRLEPGTSASWHFPLNIADEIHQNNPRSRAMVRLATGRKRYAKRRSS